MAVCWHAARKRFVPCLTNLILYFIFTEDTFVHNLQKEGKMKIIVIDDQEISKVTAGRIAQSVFPNAEISFANNGAEGIDKIRDINPDLVLTDMQMPERNGMEVAESAKAFNPDVKVIMISSAPPDTLGAVDVMMQKPPTQQKLLDALKTAGIQIH